MGKGAAVDDMGRLLASTELQPQEVEALSNDR